MNNIKQRAISSGEPTGNIIINEIKDLSSEEMKSMPKFNNIVDGITRTRNKSKVFLLI
jgi:hypothetical protein